MVTVRMVTPGGRYRAYAASRTTRDGRAHRFGSTCNTAGLPRCQRAAAGRVDPHDIDSVSVAAEFDHHAIFGVCVGYRRLEFWVIPSLTSSNRHERLICERECTGRITVLRV